MCCCVFWRVLACSPAPDQHVSMRPVRSQPVPGTAWHEVQTDTGHTYWFNPTSQESCWEIPDDVKAQQGRKGERDGDGDGEQKGRSTRNDGGGVAGGGGVHRAGEKGIEKEKEKERGAGRKPSRTAVPVVDEKMMAAMRRAKANGAVLAPEYEALLAKELAGRRGKDERTRKKEKNKEKKKEKKKKKEKEKEKKVETVAPPSPEAGTRAADRAGRNGSAGGDGVGDDFDVEFDEEDIAGEEVGGDGGGGWSREKVEERFRALLRQHGVHECSRYQLVEKKIGGDPRFVAVGDARRREALFEEFCAGVGAAGDGGASPPPAVGQKRARPAGALGAPFKALLQEKVKDHRARWDDVVHALRGDPRFAECLTSLAEKRGLFDEHRSRLANAARQRDVGDTLHARDLAAAERRRAQHAQRDKKAAFSALLGEVVRVPGTYEEVADSLRADPQRRMLEDEAAAREMHERHVARLREVALERLGTLYEARSWDKRLTFDEVCGRIEDDVEFLDFSIALQNEAWDAYRGAEIAEIAEMAEMAEIAEAGRGRGDPEFCNICN